MEKNIAIIPARSGSKGLKNKNVKLLNGRMLMSYTIEAALETGLFDCVHVSTDHEGYADFARKFGADVPFLRDNIYSGDFADTWDTARYVMEQYARGEREFETVTLLQPTSPMRTAEDIKKAFELFTEKEADSVISVCEADHSPELVNQLGKDGSMCGFFDIKQDVRRQAMKKYYRINGAIYIQKTDFLMKKKNLYGKKSYAYVMEKTHSIDIDDAFDFFLAEKMMEYGIK